MVEAVEGLDGIPQDPQLRAKVVELERQNRNLKVANGVLTSWLKNS